MSTEQLIIELDARTAKLDAKLKATENRLNDLGEATSEADTRLGKFTFSAKSAAGVVITAGKALVVLASALTAMALSSAKNRRELELLASQAKTSTSDFQALSFATSKYGIDAEKIADISKDIADKIGEFSAAGTGAFQDYADVMKLSKDQAREAAQEFEGLSSQEILGKMVSRMEDASVSGDKMTFVLESLGSDASMLIPLFKGNSSELKELKKRFDDVNKSLQITGTQAEALRDVSNTFTLMTSSIGNATTAISATLAPVFDDFFNDIIEIVPDATQTIIDFVNSFLDAENITSIAGVTKEIAASNKEIAMQKGIIDKGLNPRATKAAERILKAEKERKEELEAQLAVLQEQEKSLENAKRLKGGEIGGEDGAPGSLTGDELEGLRKFSMTRAELLDQQFVDDLDRLLLAGEHLGLTEEEQYARRLEIIRDFAKNKELLEKKELKNKDKNLKTENKWSTSANKKLMDQGTDLLTSLGNNSKTAHKIKQGLAASNAFMNTAEGVTDALAEQNYPSAALIAATGAVQIAAILSSSPNSPGGSSVSTPSAPPPSQQQPDFQPETSSLEFTDTTDTGQTTFNLTVPDGDEIGQALANWINKAQTEGRT